MGGILIHSHLDVDARVNEQLPTQSRSRTLQIKMQHEEEPNRLGLGDYDRQNDVCLPDAHCLILGSSNFFSSAAAILVKRIIK